MLQRKRAERKKRPGAPPGMLIHVGQKVADRVTITKIDYDEKTLEEEEIAAVGELKTIRGLAAVSWINVDGLHDTGLIAKLGSIFDLHPLILEDILNTQQRPKMDEYQNCIFVVLKMLSSPGDGTRIYAEQVSLVLGRGYALSFQEAKGDVFEPVRQRIRSRKGRICSLGADYLFYALVDAVVDHYFVVLENVEEELQVLEESVFQNPTVSTLADIQRLRVELLRIRRAIWPLRETISGLLREESALITEKTEIFLKDVYDHAIQVIDTVEALRDTVSGLLDIYLSSVSNRMNEVMKVLTIIATIFIPLTFIAGIYGMNFEYMPELQIVWAYPVVWMVMLVVALTMVGYFKRKGWL